MDSRYIPSFRGAGSAAWALVAALLLLGGIGAGARAEEDSALVRVDRVTAEPLSQTVPVLGRLVPRQAGSVSSRVEAPVEAFRVEVGDRVEAGQVLAVLNRDRLIALRDHAAGQLSEANAKKSTAQAQLKLADQELERLEGLKASAAFSQARYDDAKQSVAISRAQLAEAEAAVATAVAELELAQIDVTNTEIVAPYDGVVIQRMSEAGAYVSVGEAVVRLIADQSLEVEADVPYQRIAGLLSGTTVRLTLDDGSEHEAVVRAVVPEENPLTRTRAVRFVPNFNDTGRPLAADQSVTVWVPVGAPRTVLTVHKDAVIKQGDTASVFVASGDVAEPREVTLGEAIGSRYEVVKGLKEGDLVVVRGNERLRPGDKVRIDGAS